MRRNETMKKILAIAVSAVAFVAISAAVLAQVPGLFIASPTGLEQINRALTEMDEVTQRNSALVEENSATAKTLEQQSHDMQERIASFKLDSHHQGHAAPAGARARNAA